jgi:Putative peptidoglycan binding domain
LISTHTELSVLARWLRPRRITFLVAGVYLTASVLHAGTGAVKTELPAKARSSGKNTSHEAKNSVSRGKAKSAAWRTGQGASRSKSGKHHQSSHTPNEVRLSATRPEPQRVQEIQRALIQAGELREEPTGQWDEATRDAMRRYQGGHGFTATGLPDSKSLMQMGLGPHPLPPDAATPAAARASLGRPTMSDPLSVPGGDDSPANADLPQQQR